MKKRIVRISVLAVLFCAMLTGQAFAEEKKYSIDKLMPSESVTEDQLKEMHEAMRKEIAESPISLNEKETTAAGTKTSKTTTTKTKTSAADASDSGSSASEENIMKATIDGKEETFYVAVTEENENTQSGRYYYFLGLSLTDSGAIEKMLSFGVNPKAQTGKATEFAVIYYRPDYSLDEQYSKKAKQKAVYTLTVNEENGTHLEGTFEADLKTGSRYGYAVIPISGSFNLNYGEQVDSVKELYDIAKGRRTASGSAVSGSLSSGSADTKTTRKETVDDTCRTCKGTGRCYICGGDGLNRTGSDEGKVHKCHTCRGTGTCQVCYGSGVVR